MKREMDYWRKFILNEQSREPTVGEFMATFGSQSPKAASKILGKVAKFALSAAVGAGAGALAGAATGGAGAALVGPAAGATNAMLSKLFEKVAEQSGEMAKFMIAMSENQVDDGERTGLALYYDLDDEYENLIQGMDSNLANKFQESYYDYLKQSFSNMRNADPGEPLKDYIDRTANQHLQMYLNDKDASGVGVAVTKSSS
tara:strand:+ start:355 stop:957 length:603 start_codon:yes stop_codon:yes gene_type:complete